MHKHRIVKIGFVALALVMGAGAIKSSSLEASGYIVASSVNGEPTCEPGGASDCNRDL